MYAMFKSVDTITNYYTYELWVQLLFYDILYND